MGTMSVTFRSRMCHLSSESSATCSANASNLLNLHQVGDQAGVEYGSHLAALVELGDLEQTRGRVGEMEVSWRRRGPLEPVKDHRPWGKGDMTSNPGSAPNTLCDLRHNTPIYELQFTHVRNGQGS